MNPTPISKIPAPGLKRPVRIAHITDSHIGNFSENDPGAGLMKERMEELYGKWGRDFERYLGQLLQRAGEERADAVFLTGDAINFVTSAAIDFTSSLFGRAPCPIYFISGNHDQGVGFPSRHRPVRKLRKISWEYFVQRV